MCPYWNQLHHIKKKLHEMQRNESHSSAGVQQPDTLSMDPLGGSTSRSRCRNGEELLQ